MATESAGRRVIEVNRHILGSSAPRPRSLRPTKLSDYPRVSAVHLQVAKRLSNPLLMGPPICDELIAFVQHLFTEEEAAVVRHLRPLPGRTAADVARREQRPLEQIEPILQRLANVKRTIAASGPAGKEKYRLMPIMPGIFEMVLIGESMDRLTPWHRRFAELFEALYETGYVGEYQEGQKGPTPFARFLSVGGALDAHPLALPSDRLEVVLDRFDLFGVGQCQCRLATQAVGRGCGKPLSNCTAMGHWARQGIRQGWLRQVSQQNVLEIKREAESHGLVTWIMNVESSKGQVSCSCCGCCCHAMRMISEFNVPGAIAPAHFLPRFDLAKCNYCGKCARTCPTAALGVDTAAKTHQHLPQRCIGCGLCVVACDRCHAVAMQPVPHYKLPYRSWFSLLMHTAPGMARSAWKVWKKR